MKKTALPAAFALLAPVAVLADVVESSPTHYVLRHEATSTLSAEALWARLIEPSAWWHPDHTYSGDAKNLSLDLEPGGLWAETWDGGAVTHGTVLLVTDGQTLRMNAPFGPLQEVGAHTIWTITVSENGAGSKAVFDEVASGPPTAKLDELAGAVDYVKTEAIKRLTED